MRAARCKCSDGQSSHTLSLFKVKTSGAVNLKLRLLRALVLLGRQAESSGRTLQPAFLAQQRRLPNVKPVSELGVGDVWLKGRQKWADGRPAYKQQTSFTNDS